LKQTSPPLGLLFDARLCVGCHGCVLACRERNDLPKTAPLDRLGEDSFLGIEPRATRAGARNVRRACMHCLKPACAAACPVGALKKREDGSVTYDDSICIGCRYCVVACPFDVPRYEWTSPATPRVRKCHLCWQARQERPDSATACAAVCPTGALLFGERAELMDEAHRRIAGDGYQTSIYGANEVGGAGVLIISDVPFAELGLRAVSIEDPLPELTWNYLSRVPNVASGVTIGIAGLWWIIRRRRRLMGDAPHD
jgi:formate dehydrogenase iron-sulfur subunit